MEQKELNRQIPWWTWLAPICIQLMARFTGPFVFIQPGFYLVYLPYLVGSVFVLWWGPRVVLGVGVASLIGSFSGTHLDHLGIILLAAAEMLKVYLGWWFWKYLNIYRRNLKKVSRLFYCWALVFVIPNFIGSYILMAVLTLGGIFSENKFLRDYLQMSLADTLMTLVLSFPIFMFFSEWMTQKGWTLWRKSPFS
ncbi:hypothetical protein [Bdellovibrio sp. HCB288]|uniref:hypothetical protein n=1 Tax=Bdellovibrio sp. HCB288 TaxID=3394355 RepID=UPI0039B3DF0C